MIRQEIGTQLNMFGTPEPIYTYRFEKPVAELRAEVLENKVRCDNCWDVQKHKRRMLTVDYLYNTPWNVEPNSTTYFCSEKCKESYLEDTFYCDCCNREIYVQNPKNTIHTQYRMISDCEMICLECYEKQILQNGLPRESFEKGQIPGMFFSYGDSEPLEAGYKLVATKFIRSDYSIKECCQRALELIDSGHQVVVGYERMAIGGSEGTVSLFARKEQINEYCAA